MDVSRKILLAIFLVVFSVGAFACGGGKDKEEDKRFEDITLVK